MKNRLIYLLVILLCACAPLAHAAPYGIEMKAEQQEVMEEGDVLLTFDIEYPEISGLPDAAVMGTLNADLRAFAGSSFDELCLRAKEDYDTNPREEWYPYEIYTRCEVELCTDSLLSVFYSKSTYEGGAHGYTAGVARHYDLTTGNVILLESLVKDAGTFQKAVADALMEKINAENLAEEIGYFDGYEETVAEWPMHIALLTEDGLLILFNPYDLASYADGAQFLLVPYDAVEGLWNDAGQALMDEITAG